MKGFDRSNKTTGVHWLKGQVENIKISVHLRPNTSLSSIPNFEDYANDPSSFDLQTLEQDPVEEFTFKWQDKVFSKWELTRYSDIHNCHNELKLDYNKLIEDNEYEPSEVSSYVHEDYYLPVPFVNKKIKDGDDLISKCMQKLNMGNMLEKFTESTISMRHLFKSEENLNIDEEWRAMHVVLDCSEYNEAGQLIMRKELVLLSLYHNTKHNYLLVSPDNNDLEQNPYEVEGRSCQYAVEVDFGETAPGEELLLLLQKLSKRRERHLRQIMPFVMPPIGRKRCSFVLEILAADHFNMDDMYVQYEIKVPEPISCDDVLKGRTHTSRLIILDGKKEWDFGYLTELNMEMDDGKDPFTLQMFFEVISVDLWNRHRTEGYCYLALTPRPGRCKKQLSCTRPQERDTVEAESRRFFVGGCNLLKDLDVLAKPYLLDDNIVFKTTGNLNIRWNTIIQYSTPGVHGPSTSAPSSASALLQGAEAALRQYRKARARLAAATKDLRYQESVC